MKNGKPVRYPPLPPNRVQPTKKMKMRQNRKSWKKESEKEYGSK